MQFFIYSSEGRFYHVFLNKNITKPFKFIYN